MKSPVQILVDKRNEIQAEYNRVLKLHLSGIATLRHRNSFEWGKRVDLDRIKSQINQYNAKNEVKQRLMIEVTELCVSQLQSEVEKAKELIKMAQNLTAGTSKESFERFDRFMKQSTTFLEGSGNKTK